MEGDPDSQVGLSVGGGDLERLLRPTEDSLPSHQPPLHLHREDPIPTLQAPCDAENPNWFRYLLLLLLLLPLEFMILSRRRPKTFHRSVVVWTVIGEEDEVRTFE